MASAPWPCAGGLEALGHRNTSAVGAGAPNRMRWCCSPSEDAPQSSVAQTRVAQACGCASAEVTGANGPHGERPYSGHLGQGGLQLQLQQSVHAAQIVSEWRAPSLVALFRDFEAKLAGSAFLPKCGQW